MTPDGCPAREGSWNASAFLQDLFRHRVIGLMENSGYKGSVPEAWLRRSRECSRVR